MKRLSFTKFSEIFRAMKGVGSERNWITIEDTDGLIFDSDMAFADFFEANRNTVQLYDELEEAI